MHLSSLTPKLKKFIDGVEPLKRYFAMAKDKNGRQKNGMQKHIFNGNFTFHLILHCI